jgi:hypothetical protein
MKVETKLNPAIGPDYGARQTRRVIAAIESYRPTQGNSELQRDAEAVRRILEEAVRQTSKTRLLTETSVRHPVAPGCFRLG